MKQKECLPPQPPKGGQKTLNILKETFLSLSYCYLCSFI